LLFIIFSAYRRLDVEPSKRSDARRRGQIAIDGIVVCQHAKTAPLGLFQKTRLQTFDAPPRAVPRQTPTLPNASSSLSNELKREKTVLILLLLEN
jgi:hypothetical protein